MDVAAELVLRWCTFKLGAWTEHIVTSMFFSAFGEQSVHVPTIMTSMF